MDAVLSKKRDVLCSCIPRLSIKMSVPLKAINRFNAITIKISEQYLCNIHLEADSKIHTEMQRTRIAGQI